MGKLPVALPRRLRPGKVLDQYQNSMHTKLGMQLGRERDAKLEDLSPSCPPCKTALVLKN